MRMADESSAQDDNSKTEASGALRALVRLLAREAVHQIVLGLQLESLEADGLIPEIPIKARCEDHDDHDA